jgi:peroxiredoxin Q/BCP
MRTAVLSSLLAAATMSTLAAQQPVAPPPPTLAVGTEAPDFTLAAAVMGTVSAKPVHLKDLRGQTVVLAFFPRARSSGCTVQMEAYRDKYAELFGNTKVTLLSISVDPDTMLAAWTKEKNFTWSFLSDLGGTVGAQYGAKRDLPNGVMVERRILYVIGPDGKIAHVMAPFREVDATSYTELGETLKKVAGPQ